MNGGIIGGQNPVTRGRRRGVWGLGNPEFERINMPFPTSGLVNHWPLTSDGNDIVGSAHLSNNNSVTFSAAGARIESAAKRYLFATYTFPAVGTIIFDLLLDTDKYMWIGAQDSIGRYSCGTIVGKQEGCAKILRANAAGTAAGSCAGGSFLLPYTPDDGKYHTIARGFYNVAPSDPNPNIGPLHFDGVCVGGVAHFQGVTLSKSFKVGRAGDYDGGYSDGYVRNLRIFNRLLTIDEIVRMSV